MPNRLEAKMTTKLIHWLRSDQCSLVSCAIEIKICRSNSLSFNAVKDHQISALQIANTGCLVWKIPDSGFSNPFDLFILKEVPAYLVIIHEKTAYFIPIKVYTQFAEFAMRKSMTLDDIYLMAERKVVLK